MSIPRMTVCLFVLASTAWSVSCPWRNEVLAALAEPHKACTRHQAPLRYCDGSKGKVKEGEFSVQLYPDRSFEEHCRVVGDMGKYGAYPLKWVYPDFVRYICKHCPGDVLEAIRADPAVDFIECAFDPGFKAE